MKQQGIGLTNGFREAATKEKVMASDYEEDFFPTNADTAQPSITAAGTNGDGGDEGDDPALGLLPAGPQRARLVHHEYGRSAIKGTPQMKAEFEIIGGDYDKERVAHTLYFTPATTERTIRDLKTLGCKVDTEEDILRGTGLGSVEVRIVIGHECRRDGQWVERVTAILPAADATGTLEEQIRAALKAGARSGGGPFGPPPPSAPPIRKPRR